MQPAMVLSQRRAHHVFRLLNVAFSIQPFTPPSSRSVKRKSNPSRLALHSALQIEERKIWFVNCQCCMPLRRPRKCRLAWRQDPKPAYSTHFSSIERYIISAMQRCRRRTCALVAL